MRVRSLAVFAVLLVSGGWLLAQTTTVLPDCRVASIQNKYADGDWRMTIRCEPNGTQAPVIGDKAQVSRVVVAAVAPAIGSFSASATSITLGQSVTFSWSGITGTPTPALSINHGVGPVSGSSRTVTPTATGALVYTLSATNSAGTAMKSWTVTVTSSTPPPPTGNIWGGAVDASILGNCLPTTHDARTVDGGDGWRYRVWHPQTDPTGCVYAHEHGPDPAPVMQALVAEVNRLEAAGVYSSALAATARAAATAPLLMGKIARLMPMPNEPNGHLEPHEGFKVFYAYRNELNDENRRSRIVALFLTHMGTGGVGRFTMPHHSVVSRQIHDTGAFQFTQRMMDFGTANTVCNPRVSPTRDFIAILTSPCGIDSAYEIWIGRDYIGGYATAISTPAVFDPITVMNRSNPSELVYAWDPRVLVTRNHDGDDWSTFRGCSRESYAQMPAYHVGGLTDVWTDGATGQTVPAGTVNSLRQLLYVQQAGADLRGSDDGNHAFKIRRNHCGQRAALGLKN